ncbi:MAG: hypothetical protein Q8N60_05500 [Candidatus Diapherotrites archaeon]|nr:hypothetical protein [Candidatus Diapherotrites archaeon]
MGEIRVLAKGNEFALLIPQQLFSQLDLNPGAAYELVKAKKGIWVLIEKEAVKENPIDKKIFAMLKQNRLQDRVEEKFEKLLNKEELQRFKEMLKEGSVVAFKLSDKYKKAVYKTRAEMEEEKKDGNQAGDAGNSAAACDVLEKNGFLLCKDEQSARAVSQQLRKEIEEGKIRGIKGFDGFFYVIETRVYNKHRAKLLSLVNQRKSITVQQLAAEAGLSTALVKTACEFLKDEGEIIEKRHELMQAV